MVTCGSDRIVKVNNSSLMPDTVIHVCDQSCSEAPKWWGAVYQDDNKQQEQWQTQTVELVQNYPDLYDVSHCCSLFMP